MDDITLPQAARLLGIQPGTLRQAVQRGTLTARLVQESRGTIYWVAPAEVERYRQAHLGRRGRPRKTGPDPTEQNIETA